MKFYLTGQYGDLVLEVDLLPKQGDSITIEAPMVKWKEYPRGDNYLGKTYELLAKGKIQTQFGELRRFVVKMKS